MNWPAAALMPTSWEAARWASEGSQRERMNLALHLAEPLRAGNVVLDWGCGTGRLSEFLAGSRVNYVGVDTCRAMVERARRDHPDPGAEFLHLNSPNALKETRPDVTFCLGVWNLEADGSRMDAIEELEKLWRVTNRVLVASFHSSLGEVAGHHRWGSDLLAETAESINDHDGVMHTSLWELHRWKSNDLMLVLRRPT